MRALVDTCVLIDTLQNREPFSEFSKQIFLAAANYRFSGCITAKSIADIYYLMHRFTHDDKKTREILSTLLDIFDLSDTTATDCKAAIVSEISDFEDAILIETAVREHIDCIVTRNTRDYKGAPLPVYEPEAFLELIK